MSRIKLKLFALIDEQLQKAKRSEVFSIIFFKGFLLVVLIRDFYQFVPVIKKAL